MIWLKVNKDNFNNVHLPSLTFADNCTLLLSGSVLTRQVVETSEKMSLLLKLLFLNENMFMRLILF